MTEEYEGDEHDVADVETLIRMRDAARPGPEDPAMREFRELFDSFGARHFKAEELMVLGPSHAGTGPCGGKNSLPDRNLWENIRPLVAALDAIRDEIGSGVIITNCYRNEAYNACVGGARSSQHKLFKAADFICRSGSSRSWARAAQTVRSSGAFRGGIGTYRSFVHVDVRGTNVDWDNS